MNIFLVEDEEKYYEGIIDFLEYDGHTVIHVKNLKEALGTINSFDKLAIEVAILDGYMPKEENGKEIDFFGSTISEEIKKIFPEIKKIAYTNIPEMFAKYGDIYVSKNFGSVGGGGVGKLRQEVNNIAKNKTPQT